jgi:hypothetical protein
VEIDKKENDKTEVACRECQRITRHFISASVGCSYKNTYAPSYKIHYKYNYQIIRCLGCETISFRLLSQDSENHPNTLVDEYGEVYESLYDEDIYPNPYGFRKPLSESNILPDKIKFIYKETIKALNNKQPILCSIGIRALIETITKEKKASGKNLYEKINNLISIGVLTQESTDILHKLRILGNVSAHEVESHSEEKLNLAMGVIDHLLQGVYIFPYQMKRTFD